MKTSGTSPNDLELEAYALGELGEGRRAEVEKALQEDESAARRFADIERSTEEILARHPPEEMARLIEARLAREALRGSPERPASTPVALPRRGLAGPTGRIALALAGLAAVLLTAVLGFALGGGLSSRSQGVELTRAKGASSQLLLFRKTAAGSERLQNGAQAAEHDLIQIAYRAAQAGYGAIVSIDGRGGVTFQAPDGYVGGTAEAVALRPGEDVPLPHSYELDDAPRFERFFFIVSSESFALAPVAQEVRRLAAEGAAAETDRLRLPAQLSWSSFTLEKKP
ncbi:MAG TPA: hypothetical protein VMC79_06300 [Rectinemataceae bacterium]|nr:hypothetical protein [Rectinemataceae bacterium]